MTTVDTIATVPRLTISLPTFEVGGLLKTAVESIVNQTFQDWRLYVINDGGESPWDTIAHISDPRVIRIDREWNQGRYACDAWTLEHCETEWFTVHDSDDWSEPTRYEKLMGWLDSHPDAVAVTSPSVQHKTNGQVVIRQVHLRDRFPVSPTSWPATVYKTETMRPIGIDPAYRVAYDTYFMSRYFDAHPVGVVDEPLYHVVKRPESLTRDPTTGAKSQYRKRIHRALQDRYARERTGQVDYVACLLTGTGDPQRKMKRWEPDTSLVEPLAKSLPHLTVLCDEIETHDEANVSFVKVRPPFENPYFSRWHLCYRWLKARPYRDPAWILDVSDVVMLRTPKMEARKLYVGVNPKLIGENGWLKRTHQHSQTQGMIAAHAKEPTLNCGTVGGDWMTLTAFLRDFTRRLPREGDRTEMGAFNETCWAPHWRKRVVFGPEVTTEFKAFEDNGVGWFQHKATLVPWIAVVVGDWISRLVG